MASTSLQPVETRASKIYWWLGLSAAIAGIATSLIWTYNHFCGQPRHDIPVFVQDGQGAPAKGVNLRLENGAVIELDEGGNAVIPKENAGKPISVRDRQTGREVKVYPIPRIIEPNGPLEVVIANGNNNGVK